VLVDLTPGPARRWGIDYVELEIDARGADLALDDGAKIHVEPSNDPVRVSLARIAPRTSARHQLSAKYAVEASAAAKLTIELPYERPARWSRPCNATPYPALQVQGEVAREGGVVNRVWPASEHGAPARFELSPGYRDVEVPFRASFALFDTFPCS
jgi:hypothetical protein